MVLNAWLGKGVIMMHGLSAHTQLPLSATVQRITDKPHARQSTETEGQWHLGA